MAGLLKPAVGYSRCSIATLWETTRLHPLHTPRQLVANRSPFSEITNKRNTQQQRCCVFVPKSRLWLQSSHELHPHVIGAQSVVPKAQLLPSIFFTNQQLLGVGSRGPSPPSTDGSTRLGAGAVFVFRSFVYRALLGSCCTAGDV